MAAPPRPARSADAWLAALGMTAAVVAVTSWGIGPVVVKLTDLPGLVVSFYRLTIGAAVLVAVLYATGRRLTWRSLRGAIPGGVAFALDILLFFGAVKLTTVADATIISALQPALVLLVVGRLFGERIRRGDVGWTVVAIAGVGIVVLGSGEVAGRSLSGDLLAVVALGAWAWYFVAAKQGRQHFAALEYQASLAVVSALVVVPVVLVARQSLVVTDRHTWMLLGIGIVMGTAGHFLMNWAHAYTSLSLVSLLTLASPVVSVAAAAILVGEPVLLVQVVGIAVVIGSLGIVVAHTTSTNRQARAVALDGLEELR